METARTIEWVGDAETGRLVLLDQTLLPETVEYREIDNLDGVIDAIKVLAVRGAPALGVAGAYGSVIALRSGLGTEGLTRLAEARPTAVNLKWAVDRVAAKCGDDPAAALEEARMIHEEDRRTCRAIGEHGAALIPEGGGVLTHCNAGALATAGIGTALAPMYVAREQGKNFKVFADETRPLLQGARLTAWELAKAGVDVTVITDGMAGVVMREGKISVVITGADRIARNGDAANKIGTYGVAQLAKAHGIPFYIAAPRSTFDAGLEKGELIPIEQRGREEIAAVGGKKLVPEGVKVYNPAFDVTPSALIRGFITEDGLIGADSVGTWIG